ncbi:MAG: acetate/propionate family kinase [Phycisphaeraceae bacterium]|nr:acetate/propionate family kinase [Phycisphaeraceae bacterium]
MSTGRVISRRRSQSRSLAPDACVFAINGGSSSIKAAVFRVRQEPDRIASLLIERLGAASTRLVIRRFEAKGTSESARSIGAISPAEAASLLAKELRALSCDAPLLGIGHRLVFGGSDSPDHQIVTKPLLRKLDAASSLDSAHLPAELALIAAFQREFRGMAQVACLDTAFHRTMPRLATLLPIPKRFFDAGVRRYGYHGISYEFLVRELARVERFAAKRRRVVFAHLGSGASMAAVLDGRSIDTTMAFSPLAGLMMGTRPGDLDPGAVIHIAEREHFDPRALTEFLNKRCGLLGISGSSNDVRELLKRCDRDRRAGDAIDLFCWSARRQLGAMIASLGGIDTLVFSGGIGEHSPEIRAGLCDGLSGIGIRLDAKANRSNKPLISDRRSAVCVRVIPTDEEVMIARHVARLVRERR